MLLSALSESEKAVRELLRKEGLPGDLQDWVAAYDSEFQQVADSRLEEVVGEEKEKVLRQGLVMRLKMILKIKRSGRYKARLVAQGFMEPGWLTEGKEDSPVASLSSVRSILFGSEEEGEVVASIDATGAFLQSPESR